MHKLKRWLLFLSGTMGVLAFVFLAFPGIKVLFWMDDTWFYGNVDAYALIFGGEISYMRGTQLADAWKYFEFSPINFLGWVCLIIGVLWTFISMKGDVKWLKIFSVVLFLTASFIFCYMPYNINVNPEKCYIRYDIKVNPESILFLNIGGLSIGSILPHIFSFFAGIFILISMVIPTEQKRICINKERS